MMLFNIIFLIFINVCASDFIREELESIIDLVKNTNSTELDLSYQEIEDEEVTEIIPLLKDLKVTTIYFNNNYIKNNGARIIIDAMKNTNLKSLSLESNEITADETTVFAGLKDTEITTLDISFNNLGETGISNIADILPGTKVRSLNLQMTNVGYNGAKVLVNVLKNTEINNLNIRGNHLGDAGATFIANALKDSKITNINFSQNAITDTGAINIAKTLKYTRITSLNLGLNFNIEKAGINAIANALKSYYILTDLHLSHNNPSIDKYIHRNKDFLEKAKNVVQKFIAGTIEYNSKSRMDFKAFLEFADTNTLWKGFNGNDRRNMIKEINKKITENFRNLKKFSKS